MKHDYYVYITTNPQRTVLYIGMTNDLIRRMQEHMENKGKIDTFAGRYYCYNLVYWEHHRYVLGAISREKEIKGWRREKKTQLIDEFNLGWNFLNDEIQD